MFQQGLVLVGRLCHYAPRAESSTWQRVPKKSAVMQFRNFWISFHWGIHFQAKKEVKSKTSKIATTVFFKKSCFSILLLSLVNKQQGYQQLSPCKQVCCPPLVPNARASLEGRNPSPLVSSVVSALGEQGSSLLDLSLFSSEVGTRSDGVLFVTKGFKPKHVFKAWYNKSYQDFFIFLQTFQHVQDSARFTLI